MRTTALAILALACAPALPTPVSRVQSTAPSGPVAPDEVAVEIVFSAPMDRAGLEDGRWLALCRRDDLRDVLRAAEAEAGLAAEAPVVPSRVELADGDRRVILRPTAPLAAEQAWAAVLSTRARAADGRPWVDQEGKARSVAVLFETGPAVDRVAPRPRWVLPPHGPVPTNIRTLRVGFDEAVRGALALAGALDAIPRPVAPDLLELQLSAPVAPGSLALELGGVDDLAGNGAAPIAALPVSRCAVDAPPELASAPRVTPGRLSLTVQATLRGMGRLVAELSAPGGSASCGTVPPAPGSITALGDVSGCPGWDPCAPSAAECVATIELTGLCPGRGVDLRIAAEDLAGHRGSFTTSTRVATLAPVAEPVVTEVLADADAPEQGGEYVEIANLGTGDLDLAGYVLAKRTATGKLVRCTIGGASARVAPGGHAVVVGGAYDGRYALPAGAVLARCGATALDGGLANGQPIAIELLDPIGAVTSSAGFVEPVERCAAGALERVHPGQPDAASNWRCPGTRSPGACNAVTPPAECPRQPW